MTLYEFNVLETYAKAEEVWANGVRLGDRMDKEHRYILYQLNSFYVEIVYNPFENKIEKLQSFSTTRLLEPYLEKIDISTLQF